MSNERKKEWLIWSFNILPLVTPWWPTGIWECYLCPGGEGNWTLLEWEGNFNLNCQVFFSWIHMIYLLIWRCWNVKSSLWWADGVEENLFKKVTVSDLNFYQKKNVWWNLALSSARFHFSKLKLGHLNEILALRGRIWTHQSWKVQIPRVLSEGGGEGSCTEFEFMTSHLAC